MSANRVREDFNPAQTCLTKDGSLARDGDKYRLSYNVYNGSRRNISTFDFSTHPLRDLLPDYIFSRAEDLTGGSIKSRISPVRVLGEYLSKIGEDELTPRSFKAFVSWLASARKGVGRRFSDSTIVGYVNRTIELYKAGVEARRRGWSQHALDTIKSVAGKILRQHRRRSAQASIDKAFSGETYYNLLKALTLEFEQCKRVLEERDAGHRPTLYEQVADGMRRIDPDPFVVLAGMSALRHGVRACEFYVITHGDLRVDPNGVNHELYLHAPNKADAFIPVDDVFVRAWEVCQQWDDEARRTCGVEGGRPDDSPFLRLGYFTLRDKTPLRVTSYMLNRSLRYFYRKWFAFRIIDDDGNERPLLHAEGDPTRPFNCPFSKWRHAFAVQYAERERNRSLTQAVMRHRDHSTTETYYLHQTRLSHAQKVSRALKTEAQSLAMSLNNAVAVGITEDTLERARRAGADLPHGVCGSAMCGGECVRADGCLNCPHLVVIASRKPRFEADREAHLKLAEERHRYGDTRGAENALSSATLCQAFIISIENKVGGHAE